MKTVVTVAPRQMELVEAAEPTPGPDQALVRVETVRICGSDLHFYLGDHPYATYPQIQGHECCGIVCRGGAPPMRSRLLTVSNLLHRCHSGTFPIGATPSSPGEKSCL